MANVLLHVGYPKAGSTFLQTWFKEHPEIYFQPKNIAQGFYNAWQLADDVQQRGKVWDNFVLTCEDLMLWQGRPNWYGLTGSEPYDYRAFQEHICKNLYALFPGAKVLLITRGYSTVFDSVYAQYISMGGVQSCETFMRVNEKMFTTFFDYNYSVELYRSVFGASNVVLLPFELLKEDPDKFQSLLENLLSLRHRFNFPATKENSAMNRACLNAYYRTSRLVYHLLKPFPGNLQTKWYLKYCEVIRAKVPHPALEFLAPYLRETIRLSGTEKIISVMKGKADVLGSEPLYQSYRSDYLIA